MRLRGARSGVGPVGGHATCEGHGPPLESNWGAGGAGGEGAQIGTRNVRPVGPSGIALDGIGRPRAGPWSALARSFAPYRGILLIRLPALTPPPPPPPPASSSRHLGKGGGDRAS
eukprot:9497888-Pyramimonas_sp.AAC.1